MGLFVLWVCHVQSECFLFRQFVLAYCGTWLNMCVKIIMTWSKSFEADDIHDSGHLPRDCCICVSGCKVALRSTKPLSTQVLWWVSVDMAFLSIFYTFITPTSGLERPLWLRDLLEFVHCHAVLVLCFIFLALPGVSSVSLTCEATPTQCVTPSGRFLRPFREASGLILYRTGNLMAVETVFKSLFNRQTAIVSAVHLSTRHWSFGTVIPEGSLSECHLSYASFV